ncbi:VanZ family protein [Bacillus subtilis]|uniref:VanZ family protein n=1 Tax=Bacillus subtilis TaxID=1423 RepID=UPI002DBBC36D|nr:VanZ family protein [Bacillus subtilis]MEC3618680.1 VanZ family protein [Bacillus subtilis]MEC3635381.1 VanZ family protein [Bacillus subtilis]MEC3642813.1 VanZ family protein [Bacillus subtilis]MEC3647039.1 VanZ family protein [Bacillus subtilis]MEC3697367.1 VanZ family protein [Bacillus subtilis]
MLDSAFLLPYLLVLYFCFIFYRLIRRVLYKKDRLPIYKHIVILCLLVYFFNLISVTLFPIPIDAVLIKDIKDDTYIPFVSGNNFIPFYFLLDIYHEGLQYYVIRSIGGNLILLLPVGLLFPLLFAKLNNVKRILLTGFFISLFIELIQLTFSVYIRTIYRSFDVDDLILNTLGTLIGYWFFYILRMLYEKLSYRIKNNSSSINIE